jgi:2,4-dienoyl-CoA reductase-like NADH-dependent reductase (Old Yellow Enzyme family)/thioredoxin reductase
MYRILEPMKIGNTELKNRIVMLAASLHMNTADFCVTDETIAYFANFAKNGVGLLITEACRVDGSYGAHNKGQIGVFDDRFIPGMKKLVDAVRREGSKIAFQLWHPGELPYNIAPEERITVNDYTLDELHGIQKKFVDAATRSYKAGADGVELHVAHNYLMEQFLLKYYNRRSDEYGAQTVEDGIRFTAETAMMIRDAIPDEDFLILAKINAIDSEARPEAMTPELCVEACRHLERAGVQMITVSAGGTDSDVTCMCDDGKRAEGWRAEWAAMAKGAVSIPVCASGDLRHIEYMEELLGQGKCDLIGMARGLIAEPEFVTKAADGRADECKHCISCLHCLLGADRASNCSINPTSGKELEGTKLKKDGAGRLAAVIGAGVGGLEAAVDLAIRGFKPIIFEKSGVIGGVEALAAVPPEKGKIGWHMEYYRHMADKLGIEIRYNTEATAAMIRQLRPCAVIVATGSDPVYPSGLPGIWNENVIDGREYLRTLPDFAGKDVVVVGGGEVGMEIGITLHDRGKKPVILEMLPPTTDRHCMYLTLPKLRERNIPLYNETRVDGIEHGRVIATDTKEGKARVFPADKVVIAMGGRPDSQLYEALKDEFRQIYCVGDARKVRKIVNAVREGFIAAASVE